MIVCNASGGERFLDQWMSLLPQASRIRKVALLAAAVLSSVAADAKTIYVNAANATSGNGTTWATSYTFLQDALGVAVPGDVVYLAKGTYYPDDGANYFFGDREQYFILNQVNLYGGFVGNETSFGQRDPEANPTILSGEIWSESVSPEYSRYWSLHVLVLQGNCTLDGVTVDRGRANGDAAPYNQGGGCLVQSGTLTLANSTISNCLAAESGGGVSGNVVATNCTFSNNVANNEHLLYVNKQDHHWLFSSGCSGGAINGNVTASHCLFANNSVTVHSLDLGSTSSATGGAISGDVTADHCIFDGNLTSSTSVFSSSSDSSATARGGAISGAVTASNCTFSNNGGTTSARAAVGNPPPLATAASSGGAIAGQVALANCSFSKNTLSAVTPAGGTKSPSSLGGAVYVENTSTLVNSTFTENGVNGSTGVALGGAIYAAVGSVLPVTNSTFLDNRTSGAGGALSCAGSVNLISNIFWFGTDTGGTPALAQNKLIYVSGRARISNRLYPTPSTETLNIVKGLYAVAVGSALGANVDFGTTDRTFIQLDPKFVNAALPVGADGLWRTADDGLRLLPGTPAAGVGSLVFLPKDTFDLDDDANTAEVIPMDAAGFARVQDDTLELGAYELGDVIIAPDISVERPVGTVLVDGVSTVDFSAFPRVATTFVIRNNGSSDLRNLVITGTGVDINSFKFNQPAQTTVAPGGTTTFAVNFTPVVAGMQHASIHIASNDPDESPFDIDLQGDAPVPDIAVEYPSGADLTDGNSLINYGAVGAASSSTKTFTIRNAGFANLDLLSISSSGTNAANFTPSAPLQPVLIPGASTTFTVAFRPSGTGVKNASIIIQSTDPDSESSFLINVTGSGFDAPEIVVSEPYSPELINGAKNDFGSVEIKLLHSKTFIVKNVGTGTLKNIGVSLSGSSAFTKTTLAVTSLKPGTQAKFTVTFRPSNVGKKSANLVITSNDANESSITIALSGTGVAKSSSTAPASLAAVSAPFAAAPVASTLNCGVVTVTRDSDGLKHLVLTVDKSLTRGLAGRRVEVSSDLMEWFSGPNYTTTLLNNKSVLRVRDNTPLKQGERRYIRLR